MIQLSTFISAQAARTARRRRGAVNMKNRGCKVRKESSTPETIKVAADRRTQSLQTADVCVTFTHSYMNICSTLRLLFMRFAHGQSVCSLWKSRLWMAGGLIDLHYHVLLLNLEGRMHRNRWWPINLQPPRRSAAVPARRISKFILLKNQFLLSLCGPEFWPGSAVCQQDYLARTLATRKQTKKLLKGSPVFNNRRLMDRACSSAETMN